MEDPSKSLPLTPLEDGAKHRMILESILDFAVFTIDLAGVVQIWNSGAERMFGWKAAEIVGRSARVLWTSEDQVAQVLEQEMVTARTMGCAEGVCWRVRKDGTRLFVESAVRPLRDAAGSLQGFSKVCRDATEQRERERLLAESRAEVAAAIEAERSRLAELFNQSPAFLAVLQGPRYIFERINEQYQKLIGDREVLGKPFAEALPEVVGQGFLRLLERVYATGETYIGIGTHVLLERVPGRALQELVVDFMYLPLREKDGRVSGVYVHGIDLTERMRTGAALRETEQRFFQAAESAQLGTFHWDIPPTGLNWNRRLKEFFWLPPDTEVDLPLAQSRIHPEDRTRVVAAMARAVRGEERYDVQYRVPGPHGELRWLHVTGEISRDEQGEPDHFSGVAQDITRQKLAAQEREALLDAERAARGEAERSSRMKDEFLATLSHELRTPLNAILGWSKLLHEGPNTPEDLEMGLGIIERNARSQKQIIEDLLDMSRIISGKVRLDVQRIDVKPVVEAAIETVRAAADAKGIRLQAVLDPTARPVSGDPNRLQQVCWNLLSNAIKFTPRGGRVQTILERVNSHLEISVIDNGPGIAPEFLPFLFDRFRQADNSITRQHGGLGLGLAIVKQLVELHGGLVEVRSGGEESGSTFVVSLPLTVLHAEGVSEGGSPVPEREERRHPQAVDSGTALVLPGGRPDLQGVSVVVVDDEADARALVKRLLEDCGATVAAAGNAEAALELVERERPAVLVSDIGMPGTDGYTLIRKVRALQPECGGATPAVALTAYARSEDRMRAVMAGFQMHVSKPVEAAELLTMVASLAGRMRVEG